jgi:hypothetical protein
MADEWRQRLRDQGGSIPCTGNCPEHMSCSGSIRLLPEMDRGAPIDGYAPLARCDHCRALFGFNHLALRFLQHG